MMGGHSGMEIGLGRGNANQQLARFIWEMSQSCDVVVSRIDGGNLANAIPREAIATIGIPADKEAELMAYAAEFNKTIHAEFALAENPDFTFDVTATAVPATIIDKKQSAALIATIFATPNGVQGMSNAVPGLIETSCNLASVKMQDDKIVITVHQRSSVDSRRDEIADRIKALYQMIGCEVIFEDAYVGWAPNPESKVLKVAESSFFDLFGEKPRVEALHAGLECALLGAKYPNWDMVSFGPTIKYPHSPDERVKIDTVDKCWKFVKSVLENIPEKK